MPKREPIISAVRDLSDMARQALEEMRIPKKGCDGRLLFTAYSPFGETFRFSLPCDDQREKHKALAFARCVFEIEGVDAYTLLADAWLTFSAHNTGVAIHPDPVDVTRRVEVLFAVCADRHKSVAAYSGIVRDSRGLISAILPASIMPHGQEVVTRGVFGSLLQNNQPPDRQLRDSVHKLWSQRRPVSVTPIN
jgi:hypothetical protein